MKPNGRQPQEPANPTTRTKDLRVTRRFLGPVQDLEAHVRPDWWRTIFNSLYLKTDADVVEDQAITSTEIDQILQILQPNTDARILDLACGQGRHALEMARRGFTGIEGMDRSHYLIQRARSIAKKENLRIKFREGDARKIVWPADTMDLLLILGNSFGYFETAHEDLKLLQEVFRVLKPWGKVLVDVTNGQFLRDNYQPRSWEWIDKNYFVCRERSLSRDNDRLISREVITHVERGVIEDRFYAERLYTEESLTALFNAAGFSDIVFHGEIIPNSQRNQDLGMMASRYIVTAVVRKEWTPISKKPHPSTRSIITLLGDPRKPDIIKPEAVFDDDDIYTVDQLKAVLKRLPQYHVQYLHNHDDLIQDLLQRKGKVDLVFNLCDEGFGNDARHELHIPALLEMLSIPYSGSGPQCLAYCYDKSLVRGIAQEMDIAVPGAFFIKPEDTSFELPFSFPVLVKPNFGDSSLGITQHSFAKTLEELVNAISTIRNQVGYDKPVLVEKFLPGKDISLGIIGNPPNACTILPIIEEDYSKLPKELPRICGYEAKWLPESPYGSITSIPAEIPESTRKLLEESSLKLFERLECRDYARFDWRLDELGEPKLLEVNPNPGWCWDGHLAKMAGLAGFTYQEMIASILAAAEQRLNLNRG
ncbi:MAG: methyltransferase domain-containing protein [Candidatus Marinimicrobia bacterium]|nr:methyltransferase domain-containing protein [Candidatus Neomarinimicrobiota bacterium]MCF7839176.1 methyltransferase domain-containing protein [Candidatus Neomarinimicrobiota bacterium]